MNRLEVEDGSNATGVEEILAYAEVAGSAALPTPHVRQRMFDGHALPQLRPALRRLLAFPHLLQQAVLISFVLNNKTTQVENRKIK